APGDRIGPRGQPLMGQGLPGGQLREAVGADGGRQHGPHVLGGTGGGGDDHQRGLGGGLAREIGDGEGEQGGGGDDAAALTGLCPLLGQGADGGEVAGRGELLEQRRQGRRGLWD